MNLALISAGEIFGGVERQILDLCLWYRAKGIVKPTVFLFNDLELARQLRDAGFDPIIIRGRHRYDWNMAGALAEKLKQLDISTVHAHGYKATITCWLAQRKFPFRLIKTEHGKVEATWARPIAFFKSRVSFSLDLFATRRSVDSVCYVTDDIRNFFAQHHGSLPGQTVYNGITPLAGSDFQRPADLPNSGLNLAIVGRVTAVKGIPLALQALRLVPEAEDINLLVIGTGPLLPELKAQAKTLGLEDRVRFLGFRENIYDYLAHIDGLVMPSFHEGLPYTLLESMSLGLGIIASKVGGLAEVLEDGHNALLFNSGNIPELARCISALFRDRTLREKLGQQAQRDQTGRFTLNEMGTTYSHLCFPALDSNSN